MKTNKKSLPRLVQVALLLLSLAGLVVGLAFFIYYLLVKQASKQQARLPLRLMRIPVLLVPFFVGHRSRTTSSLFCKAPPGACGNTMSASWVKKKENLDTKLYPSKSQLFIQHTFLVLVWLLSGTHWQEEKKRAGISAMVNRH